jgi:crossover junction endodeoxyribonuclease RusA
MKLTLPYPPSVNGMYATFRGRRILSREGRAYKKAVAEIAARQSIRPNAEPFRVVVEVYRPRRAGDLDNTLKALLDSLTGIVWVDDSQIVEIVARRFEDKANPRAEIEMESVECLEVRQAKAA